jgi:hypothetical protein
MWSEKQGSKCSISLFIPQPFYSNVIEDVSRWAEEIRGGHRRRWNGFLKFETQYK